MQTIELKVQGMSCGVCVTHVTRALKGVAGVHSAVVDLTSASAKVEGEALSVNKLIEAIEEEGYEAQIATQGA